MICMFPANIEETNWFEGKHSINKTLNKKKITMADEKKVTKNPPITWKLIWVYIDDY